MDDAASGDLLRLFDNLPDPRAHNTVHPLSHILLIAIMAVTCGAGDWQAVQRWGEATAIPKLLELLDLQGATVTIDATPGGGLSEGHRPEDRGR